MSHSKILTIWLLVHQNIHVEKIQYYIYKFKVLFDEILYFPYRFKNIKVWF